jgi:hypothetical protein
LASGLNRQTIHNSGNLPGMIGPVIVIPAGPISAIGKCIAASGPLPIMASLALL